MIVFDLDGTIADASHRLHYILNEPKNWDAFFESVFDDKPIWPVIEILNALYEYGHEIILLTGRNDVCRLLTELWLTRYNIPYEELYMRENGDRRPDHVLKKEIMDQVIIPKYGKPDIIFEDRKRVIDMWLAEGYFAVDVTGGKGDY